MLFGALETQGPAFRPSLFDESGILGLRNARLDGHEFQVSYFYRGLATLAKIDAPVLDGRPVSIPPLRHKDRSYPSQYPTEHALGWRARP